MKIKKEKDIFEKLFGKKPKKGYKYNSLDFNLGWRSVVISWSCAGVGFGEMALIFTEKGMEIDSECMSKEFVVATLKETIKRIKKGQKQTKWKFSKKTMKGRPVESKDGNEQFIMAVCQTFLFLAQEDKVLIR